MEEFHLTIDNIHHLLKEALLIIDSVSKENDLVYYLHAGTVLGAKRHKDLIPWDDDADIVVPASNYVAFIEALKSTDLGKFEVLYRDGKSTKMQAKLILKGQDEDLMCVDIFPLIGVPDDYKKQLNLCKKSTRLRRLYFWKKVNIKQSSTRLKKYGKAIIKMFLQIFTEKWFDKQFDKIMYKYDFDRSQFVTNPCGKYKMKNVIPKDWYGTPVEGIIGKHIFPIPSEWGKYLEHYYGDYMKIPSADYQKSVMNKNRVFIGTKEDYLKCIQE